MSRTMLPFRSFRVSSPRILAPALAATAGLFALAPGAAQAQVYLVGFETFQPDATGNNNGNGYGITSNSRINFARNAISLNGGTAQQTAISFALTQGNNSFTFASQSSATATSIAGISFFFNATGTSYNPNSTTGVAGNLVAVANTDNSGTFFFPAASTPVRSYDNSANYDAAYSGATSYVVGGQRITLTQYSVDTTPSGSFTLNVAPVSAAAPEPGSVALMGTCLLPLAGLAARRRVRREAPSAS